MLALAGSGFASIGPGSRLVREGRPGPGRSEVSAEPGRHPRRRVSGVPGAPAAAAVEKAAPLPAEEEGAGGASLLRVLEAEGKAAFAWHSWQQMVQIMKINNNNNSSNNINNYNNISTTTTTTTTISTIIQPSSDTRYDCRR